MCIFEFIFKLTKGNVIAKSSSDLFILVKLLSFQHANCILKFNGLFQCVKKKTDCFHVGLLDSIFFLQLLDRKMTLIDCFTLLLFPEKHQSLDKHIMVSPFPVYLNQARKKSIFFAPFLSRIIAEKCQIIKCFGP